MPASSRANSGGSWALALYTRDAVPHQNCTAHIPDIIPALDTQALGVPRQRIRSVRMRHALASCSQYQPFPEENATCHRLPRHASLKPRQLRRLLGTYFVHAGCRASPELHCPHPSHQSCPGHAGSWCPAAKDSLSEDAARLGILANLQISLPFARGRCNLASDGLASCEGPGQEDCSAACSRFDQVSCHFQAGRKLAAVCSP